MMLFKGLLLLMNCYYALGCCDGDTSGIDLMPAESASMYSQRFTEYALWAAPLQRVAACVMVCFQVSFCRIHDDEDSQLVK
jgi:hypothetical protein